MIQLEWVFFLQLALGVLMLVFIQKMNRLQKEVDGIIKEIKRYLEFIEEEEAGFCAQSDAYNEEVSCSKSRKNTKILRESEREELQNQLIQTVLGEYFP